MSVLHGAVRSHLLTRVAPGGFCAWVARYAAIDRWLYDMLTGKLVAEDERGESSKRRRSLDGTPLEDAYIRLAGGELMRFVDWHELPADARPARVRGAGPTLLITFSEVFHGNRDVPSVAEA